MAKDRKIELELNLKLVGAEKLKETLRGVASGAERLNKDSLGGTSATAGAGRKAKAKIPEVLPGDEPGGLKGFLGKLWKSAGKVLSTASPQASIAQLLGGGKLGSFAGKAIAGALGSAAGPVGTVAAAINLLTPVVKSLASAPFKAITAGMSAVNGALKGLLGSLGPIGSLLGVVQGTGSAIKSVGDSLGPLGIGLSVMGGAIEGITKQIQELLGTAIQLAAKANPGVVKRLQIALDDTAAVVGHRLTPVVEVLTNIIRGLGDMLQTILPRTSEFRAALAPLGDAWNSLKEALLPIGVVIKTVFIVGLKILTAQLKVAAAALNILLQPLIQIGKFAGLNWKTSVGAAARPVTFTSPEDYAKEVYKAAAGSKGADEQIADNTKTMVDILQDIRDRITGGLSPQTVAAAATAVPGVSAAASAITGIQSWLGIR